MYFCTFFFVVCDDDDNERTKKKVYKLETIFSSKARKSIIKTLERMAEGEEATRRDSGVACATSKR